MIKPVYKSKFEFSVIIRTNFRDNRSFFTFNMILNDKYLFNITFLPMININAKAISNVICRIILTGLYGYILLLMN